MSLWSWLLISLWPTYDFCQDEWWQMKASKGQSFIIGYCWDFMIIPLTHSVPRLHALIQHQQKFQPLKIHLSWCTNTVCTQNGSGCCCAPPMGFVRTTKSERQVDMTVDGEQLKQQQLGKRISSPPTFISAQCAKVQLFAIHAEKTIWMFLRSGKSLPLSASKSHTSNETYVHTNVQVCRIIRAPAFDINPWDSRKKSKRRFHLIFYYS